MTNTDSSIATQYIHTIRESLAKSLIKISHCLNQLDDAHMSWRPFEQQNSLTNLILHLCGNLRQWIISAADDQPDHRNRPAEFAERAGLPRADLIGRLTQVIHEADAILASLTPEKLLERRRIQGFDTNLLAAIYDSASHLVGHTQEIIHITRFLLREKYKFHWQPKTAEQGKAV